MSCKRFHHLKNYSSISLVFHPAGRYHINEGIQETYKHIAHFHSDRDIGMLLINIIKPLWNQEIASLKHFQGNGEAFP